MALYLTRRRFLVSGLTFAAYQVLNPSAPLPSVLYPANPFAGRFYDPYDAQFLSKAAPDFYRLLADMKQTVRKSMYPIKTTYTWQPYPKATGEDTPVWVRGMRRGFVTIVTYREKLYALSVSHVVVPTAKDLHEEKIRLKDDLSIEIYVGNTPTVLDKWILDQVEEVAVFRIPASLSVSPLTYALGDSDKLELKDMIIVVAPRDLRIGSITSLHGEDPIKDLELGTPQNTFLTDVPVMPGFSGSLVFAISKSTPFIVGLAEGIYIKQHQGSEGRIEEDFQSVMIRINKFKELIDEKSTSTF